VTSYELHAKALEDRPLKNVKAPTGDFRDWEAINKWAAGIAEAVKK